MFSLDYKSRLPIYEQLYQSITKMSALGGLDANAQLPSVRSLALELGVNPNTVQKAYRLLERDGIIYSVPGKGSFIASDVSALSQQRTMAVARLDEGIRGAGDCGITKPEMLERIETYFNGRKPVK